MRIIRVGANEKFLAAQVESAGSIVSGFTGAQLQELEVRISTFGEEEKEAAIDLQSKATLSVFDDQGNVLGMFALVKHSYSYQDGSPLSTFLWKLTQIEQVKAEKLIMNGLELVPYEYRESLDDKGLFITARVRISAAERELLENLPEHFSVIRRGVSETPREMRMGWPIWSSDADDFKFEINLFDHTDSKGSREMGLLDPQLGNGLRMILELSGTVEALISLLVKKGTITAPEKEELMQLAEKGRQATGRNLRRVTDLDAFEFND